MKTYIGLYTMTESVSSLLLIIVYNLHNLNDEKYASRTFHCHEFEFRTPKKNKEEL